MYLDQTSKRHNIQPNMFYCKPCTNCGSITHRDKECKAASKCLRCASTDHKISNCKVEEPKCINCGKGHICFSELCDALNEKTFNMNKYLIELLVGEKVVENKNALLKTPRMIKDVQMPPVMDEDLLERKIKELTQNSRDEIRQLFTRIEKVEKLQNDLAETVKKQNEKLSEDIQIVKADIENVKKDVMNNVNELKKSNEEGHKDTKDILKSIIEMMKANSSINTNGTISLPNMLHNQ